MSENAGRIKTGKAFKKALNEFTSDLENLRELSRELLPKVRRQRPGVERDELLALMQDLLSGELPPPQPKPRSKWDSQDWLAEAEWQRTYTRLWRIGGYSDKARQCEADARTADKEGRGLKEQGR